MRPSLEVRLLPSLAAAALLPPAPALLLLPPPLRRQSRLPEIWVPERGVEDVARGGAVARRDRLRPPGLVLERIVLHRQHMWTQMSGAGPCQGQGQQQRRRLELLGHRRCRRSSRRCWPTRRCGRRCWRSFSEKGRRMRARNLACRACEQPRSKFFFTSHPQPPLPPPHHATDNSPREPEPQTPSSSQPRRSLAAACRTSCRRRRPAWPSCFFADSPSP